jgi:hypothetical protein
MYLMLPALRYQFLIPADNMHIPETIDWRSSLREIPACKSWTMFSLILAFMDFPDSRKG